MQKKKGISLIVLVITIIVMIILAAAVVISLSQNGIIGKANEAVDTTNLKSVQQAATLLWADAYVGGARTEAELEDAVLEGLEDIENLDLDNYTVTVTETGVTVTHNDDEDALEPGLYETGTNYTVLKTSWDDLLSSGTIIVDNGLVYVPADMRNNIDGDLMLPEDGSVTSLSNYNYQYGTGELGFGYCKYLTGIILPSSVTSIGVSAFEDCTNLSSITIPASVTSIENYAFAYCTNLNSIVIPSSVTAVYNCAFLWSTVGDVYYSGSADDWAEISFGCDNEALTDATIHYEWAG